MYRINYILLNGFCLVNHCFVTMQHLSHVNVILVSVIAVAFWLFVTVAVVGNMINFQKLYYQGDKHVYLFLIPNIFVDIPCNNET
jgi:hypothetical protein